MSLLFDFKSVVSYNFHIGEWKKTGLNGISF